MPYYKICPECGASLDPGETCDCHKQRIFDILRERNPLHDLMAPGEQKETPTGGNR